MNDDHTQRRLEQLFQISQVIGACNGVDQAFQPTLDIAVETLPIRSAVLMADNDGAPRILVWPSAHADSEAMRLAKDRVTAAYGSLMTALSEAIQLSAPGEPVASPPTADGTGAQFVVIPLTMADRRPFGALQLEGALPMAPADLLFVNAIASQLAIAFERERIQQREIARRELAEEAQGLAERAGARSELLARERGRLYDEAKQAVRVRDGLLEAVSHDLRSPLWTILMAAEALSDGPADPSELGRIERAATRMLRLIDDLLDFASIEAGRLAMVRAPHDAGPIVLEAITGVAGLARKKGATLATSIAAGIPRIHCDDGRILQVLINLVGNAISVTGSDGRVTLGVEAGDHEVVFSVADNGHGIDADSVAHIFDRYWRSHHAEYKGTGLGLAISAGIVAAHGGRIWVESTVGAGATFWFTVPIADDKPLFQVPFADAEPQS